MRLQSSRPVPLLLHKAIHYYVNSGKLFGYVIFVLIYKANDETVLGCHVDQKMKFWLDIVQL